MWHLKQPSILLLSCITVLSNAQSTSDPVHPCASVKLRAVGYSKGIPPYLNTGDGGLSFLLGNNETDVIKNSLDIETIPSTHVITGSNTMTIQSKISNLTQFKFQLGSNFTISSLKQNGANITFNRLDAINVVANLNPTVPLNNTFTLEIAYNGVANDTGGFGSINWTTHAGQNLVFTLSEPYYSYTWWPTKDDNTDKTLMDIAVTVPNTMKVVGNGTLTSTTVIAGNKLKYAYTGGNPMSPYLLCFSATNYNKFTDSFVHSGGTMPMEFFLYPEDDTTANRNAWLKTKQMLALYPNWYGPYPFLNEKYGIYEFNFGGGMEHQTMTGQGTTSENVTAHELGHQWWGDMVTCGTWSDIWLNEGFATYTECLWNEYKGGSDNKSAYFSAINARTPGAVSDTVYCYNTSDPNRIFSSTYSYYKAAWVLHMLRNVMGDTLFFQNFQTYRSRFAYKSAVTADFVQSASDTLGSDLNWFFNEWVMQGGAPAYQYGWTTRTVNGQSYVLLMVKQTQTAYPVFRMPIDVRPTVGGSPVAKSVLNTAATQYYVIPTTATATALSFDPDNWILKTAATTTTYVDGPPKIVTVSPAPGSALTSKDGSRTVQITFHRPVNVALANFQVTSGATNIPFTLSYNASTNTASLTFSSLNATKKGVRVSVLDTVKSQGDNLALDGEANEAAPVFPSGDGLAGGSCVFTYPR